MNYDWMKYEDIEKSVYPNLLAEIKESGFSICTISDFMGRGRCEEDDKTVWDKLTGKEDILEDEATELAEYYGVEEEYLFSHELWIVDGKSKAYWRWCDETQESKEILEKEKVIDSIEKVLRRRPEIFECMKLLITLTEEQQELALQLLRNRKKKQQ